MRHHYRRASGQTCNSLDATGPCVTQTAVGGSPPVATGGTLVPGTYDLTSDSLYGAPDSGALRTRRLTLVIGATASAGSFSLDQASQDGTTVARRSFALTVSGTSITATDTCPLPDGGTVDQNVGGYTATSSQLTLIGSGTPADVSVFVKR